MIILITGTFPTYDKYGIRNGKEFVVSHGYDPKTGKDIITTNDHHKRMGGRFDMDMGEWVLDD